MAREGERFSGDGCLMGAEVLHPESRLNTKSAKAARRARRDLNGRALSADIYREEKTSGSEY